jgi:hypothetical protein
VRRRFAPPHTIWALCPNKNDDSYKNRFFESPPLTGFQKTNFGISSAEGAGNPKIGFTMRISSDYLRAKH